MSSLDTVFSSALQAHQSGDLTTAANGYATVLQANPGHADAWHLAGVLAHQKGRSEEAVEQIHLAVQLNPTNPEYLGNLASILNKLERHEEANQAADIGLQIQADYGPVHFQKAMALLGLNQLDASIDWFQSALQVGFAADIAWRHMSDVYQRTGNMPEAIAALERSWKQNPVHPATYFQFAEFVRSKEYQFSSDQVRYLQVLADGTKENPKSQARVHWALAVHCEQSQDFDSAFHHFAASNEASLVGLEQRGIRFGSEIGNRRVDDLTEFFTKHRIEFFQNAGHHTSQPIFIVGLPRSGTTLAQQILSQHPAIVGLGELTDISDLVGNEFGKGDQTPMRETLPNLTERWVSDAANLYLSSTFEKAVELNQGQPVGEEVCHTVDKMPGNYLNIGFIRMLFPNATIIHMQRDPRDVCLSCYCQSFHVDGLQVWTAKLESIAEVYRHYDRIMQHWHQVMPGQIYNLVYEDLIESPEDHIRKLLDHINLPWHPDCLEFQQGQTTVKTASAVQVRQPLYQSSRQKWRKYEKQLQPLIEQLAVPIARFENR
ncbi:MAG: sulfotransferase [Planctomycetales bacterium]|nr:sulfotransferase [Planctomycetales bacterium]